MLEVSSSTKCQVPGAKSRIAILPCASCNLWLVAYPLTFELTLASLPWLLIWWGAHRLKIGGYHVIFMQVSFPFHESTHHRYFHFNESHIYIFKDIRSHNFGFQSKTFWFDKRIIQREALRHWSLGDFLQGWWPTVCRGLVPPNSSFRHRIKVN